MTKQGGHAAPRSDILFTRNGRAARHRRRVTGCVAVLVRRELMAQPVRDHMQVSFRDAEALHHVAQPAQRLDQRQVRIADAAMGTLGHVAGVGEGVATQVIAERKVALAAALRAAVGIELLGDSAHILSSRS